MSELDTFNKYLSSVDLLNVSISEIEHWIERVYIDKKTRKLIGLIVYPPGFVQYYIYFDELTCKELYPDPLDSSFHSFGLNWFTYKGISEQDTIYGQALIDNTIEHSKKIFNYIKTKIEIDTTNNIV